MDAAGDPPDPGNDRRRANARTQEEQDDRTPDSSAPRQFTQERRQTSESTPHAGRGEILTQDSGESRVGSNEHENNHVGTRRGVENDQTGIPKPGEGNHGKAALVLPSIYGQESLDAAVTYSAQKSGNEEDDDDFEDLINNPPKGRKKVYPSAEQSERTEEWEGGKSFLSQFPVRAHTLWGRGA